MDKGIGPTRTRDRIVILDIWRGFALLGVVIVNFISRNHDFLSPAREQALDSFDWDWKTNILVSLLFANKFNTLFSLLFGVGFAIILERAGRGPDADTLLLRRMLVLLVIGWLHFLFVFSGEEIHVYAVCGLALLLLRRLPDTLLLAAGIFLAIVPRLVVEEWAYVGAMLQALAPNWHLALPPVAPPDIAARYAAVHDPLGPVYLSLNLSIALDSLRNWPISGMYFLYFLGRILIGFALWRLNLIRRIVEADLRCLRAACAITGAASIALIAAALTDWAGTKGTFSHLAYNFLRQLSFFVISAFYVLSLTLLARDARVRRILAPLAAVGRMSLTNYLLQSLFLMAIVAGPGLRLAGDVGSTTLAGIAIGVFALQVLTSQWWSKRYEYGPVEWLWRTLTYRPRPGWIRNRSAAPP